jgi:hypothetical protein
MVMLVHENRIILFRKLNTRRLDKLVWKAKQAPSKNTQEKALTALSLLVDFNRASSLSNQYSFTAEFISAPDTQEIQRQSLETIFELAKNITHPSHQRAKDIALQIEASKVHAPSIVNLYIKGLKELSLSGTEDAHIFEEKLKAEKLKYEMGHTQPTRDQPYCPVMPTDQDTSTKYGGYALFFGL